MNPSISLELPIELTDNIIEYIKGDTNALLACRMLSEGWMASADRYLFRQFTVLGNEAAPPGLLGFLILLRDSPRVGFHIQSLTITENNSDNRWSLRPCISALILQFVLSHLPNLKSLTLDSCRVIYPNNDSLDDVNLSIPPCVDGPYHLENLSLSKIQSPSFSPDSRPLRDIFALFSFIGRLHLTFFGFPINPTSIREGYTFRKPYSQLVLSSLPEMVDLSCVQSLVVKSLSNADIMERVVTFFNCGGGRNISYLELYFTLAIWYRPQLALDLSLCTKLHTVTIYFGHQTSPSSVAPTFESLAQIHHQLHTIVLHVTTLVAYSKKVHGPNSLKMIPWNQLRDLTGKLEHLHLIEVRFQPIFDEREEIFDEIVEKELPQVKKMKKLSIIWLPPIHPHLGPWKG
ncbi:hypothetical protein ABKN59_011846 [Abortiporus biennis]